MIGQYLSNKNESATIAKFKIFPELNKALDKYCSNGRNWGAQARRRGHRVKNIRIEVGNK